MKVGNLYVSKRPATPEADTLTYVEVIGTYDKRDIDYECPESVAIIPMVTVLVLSGPNIGTKHSHSRRQFRRLFTEIKEAS
ncbi:MAG: hypothetical protein CBB97_00365 [Candidatus Endolissoclinum sp. TMED37]|nr:MAG: hypothetical protein CBB97_00365 [Candidatus Endolissoclinum sp. TMED37]